MRIGVGLPTATPDSTRELLLEWASLSELASFSSVACCERPAAPAWDPLVVLSTVAAVTRRIRLATVVLVGPPRDTAILAKETATLDHLSNGRLVLGLGLGRRGASAAGAHAHRGNQFSRQLVDLRSAWERETVARPSGRYDGPTLLVGGSSAAAFARVAQHADGHVHIGGCAADFARAAGKVRAAWRDFERPGRPQVWGRVFFLLGNSETVERGRDHVRRHYRFLSRMGELMAEETLTSSTAIRNAMRDYANEDCDELLLLPAVSGIEQLERLATVAVG